MTEDWLTEGYEYTDLDVFRFLCSLCKYRDNEAHPYNDAVYVTADEWYFGTSYDDVKEMAYELFGNDSFITSEYAEEMFDSVSQSYYTPNGIGLWTSQYSYEDMAASEDDKNVYVKFTLVNSKLYEYEEMNYGQYEFVFSKNSNHEYTYLTLYSIQKCE